MKKYYVLLILFFLSCSYLFGQGKLLLIGGGGEKDSENSWNYAAYKWAVDHSANKRVAIVSYYDASDWLPNYFISQCGAINAKNFKIDCSKPQCNNTRNGCSHRDFREKSQRKYIEA